MSLSKLQEMVKDREGGVLQSTGSQGVGHDWATEQQPTLLERNISFVPILFYIHGPIFKMSFSTYRRPTLLPYGIILPCPLFSNPLFLPLTLSHLPLPLGLTDFASVSETCQPLSCPSVWDTFLPVTASERPFLHRLAIQSLAYYPVWASVWYGSLSASCLLVIFAFYWFPQMWAPWDQGPCLLFNLSVHLLTDQPNLCDMVFEGLVRRAQRPASEELGSWQCSLISQL